MVTRYTDSRETWHSRGARGSALPYKISCQSVHGGGNAAEKFSKFLLWSISTVVMLFYTPSYSALVFCIWDESLHWLQIYYWETARQLFTPKFSVQPVGKTMRWIEKMTHTLLICSTFSIIMQNLGKIDQLAPTGDAKMMTSMWSRCMFLFVTLQIRSAVRSRVHSLNKHMGRDGNVCQIKYVRCKMNCLKLRLRYTVELLSTDTLILLITVLVCSVQFTPSSPTSRDGNVTSLFLTCQ